MNLVRRLGAGFVLACAAARAAHAALPTVPSAAAAEAPSAVGGYGMLQAGFGMLVVLGLIFLCAWLARRFGLPRFGGGQVARVVSSTMVGQRERVVVVEVGATWLVLGVTRSTRCTRCPRRPCPMRRHRSIHGLPRRAGCLRRSCASRSASSLRPAA
ncbi:MAG: flagellar biosynthetic protein FliO [Variovorax sp.]